MNMKWYVIHTLSSQEDKVKNMIEKEKLKWAEGSRVGQVKVPTLEMAKMSRGKKRIVKKKFMPGYVFMELDITDELQRRIRSIPGVMGFVSSGTEPQVLSDEEIQNLFTEMVEIKKEEKTAPRILFSKGEVVKILEGPFANFQGTIDEVDSDKGKVKVKVEIFGRSTPVELNYLQVGKL